MKQAIVIAIDGTAASGKGTLARRLATHFGFSYLDSGKLYRLVALAVTEAGGNPSSKEDALIAIKNLHLDPTNLVMMSDPRLTSQNIGQAASIVAAKPEVRQALMSLQRNFAKKLPKKILGAAVDGRDIGTVIFPDAPAKLFVDATIEVRAHRRFLELRARGDNPNEGAVLQDIKERDTRDSNRAVAPLKPAPDAALLDTTHLGIDAAFAAALALVTPKIEALKARPRG